MQLCPYLCFSSFRNKYFYLLIVQTLPCRFMDDFNNITTSCYMLYTRFCNQYFQFMQSLILSEYIIMQFLFCLAKNIFPFLVSFRLPFVVFPGMHIHDLFCFLLFLFDECYYYQSLLTKYSNICLVCRDSIAEVFNISFYCRSSFYQLTLVLFLY